MSTEYCAIHEGQHKAQKISKVKELTLAAGMRLTKEDWRWRIEIPSTSEFFWEGHGDAIYYWLIPDADGEEFLSLIRYGNNPNDVESLMVYLFEADFVFDEYEDPEVLVAYGVMDASMLDEED
ncbi:hypothetical protein N9M21_07545 [Alphaproteobacteria bacterium]|nr:hypothetical protein [Alphaproteobacteria bacterium]